VRHDNGGESRIFEGDQLRRTADITKNNGRCRRNVHSRKQMLLHGVSLNERVPERMITSVPFLDVRSDDSRSWKRFRVFITMIEHLAMSYAKDNRENASSRERKIKIENDLGETRSKFKKSSWKCTLARVSLSRDIYESLMARDNPRIF